METNEDNIVVRNNSPRPVCLPPDQVLGQLLSATVVQQDDGEGMLEVVEERPRRPVIYTTTQSDHDHGDTLW